ncbi:hypothetical protein CRG98_005630 [Punica granatum]|uniref:Reverse transcriptase Ty1/copia-type domain-containing protein n=1 Tax=Punica granatum TaxID=22663 RepID=A0A2I0L095_PUNGR|nr:hypothetical protein CRG98_005630 [Punica granatum]
MQKASTVAVSSVRRVYKIRTMYIQLESRPVLRTELFSSVLATVRMTTILVQNGLKKVVMGYKPKRMEQFEWDELDEKALSVIQLCLTNNILHEVLVEKKTSALVWKLEALYMTKTLVNRLVFKQWLYTFCMAEGTLIRAHISEFMTLLNDLNNGEVKIDDEDKDLLLLCSLPPSYKTLRKTLIYGRDNLTFEDVKGSLLSNG